MCELLVRALVHPVIPFGVEFHTKHAVPLDENSTDASY